MLLLSFHIHIKYAELFDPAYLQSGRIMLGVQGQNQVPSSFPIKTVMNVANTPLTIPLVSSAGIIKRSGYFHQEVDGYCWLNTFRPPKYAVGVWMSWEQAKHPKDV